MKILILSVVLLLGLGCSDREDHSGYCDYCKVQRRYVYKLACEKCQQHHVGCDCDEGLTHRGWSFVYFRDCPKPVETSSK